MNKYLFLLLNVTLCLTIQAMNPTIQTLMQQAGKTQGSRITHTYDDVALMFMQQQKSVPHNVITQLSSQLKSIVLEYNQEITKLNEKR